MSSPGHGTDRWLGLVVLGGVIGAVAAAALARGARPEAVGTAALVVGIAAACGWLAPRWAVRSPAGTVAAGLLGITLRIVPPLALLAWLATPAGAALRAAAGGELLLTFYLAALAADIALTVACSLKSRGKPGRNAGN